MKIKVYYLDDEVDLLEAFKEIFEDTQIEISTFSDPQRALAEVSANPPDLLFLDHRLPNITGDEIALKLDPMIPKALITGDLEVICRAKFVAHFSKPYNIPEIQEFIFSYVNQKKSVNL